MKETWKRIRADVLWVLGVIIVAVVINYFYVGLTGWKNIWLWVAPLLLGIVLGERRWIWRWIVNIILAAKILIREEDNPKEFVFPSIGHVDVFPRQKIDLDYITINLNWTNILHKSVKITDIIGKVHINGSQPPDEFNYREPIVLEAHSLPTNDKNITKNIIVDVKRDAFDAVKRMRQEKYGFGTMVIDLSLKLNNKDVTYSLYNQYQYVSTIQNGQNFTFFQLYPSKN
jgi:hypothetical protein